MEPSQLLDLLRPHVAGPPAIENPEGTLAAVLVIIHFHDGMPHVILTKRSDSVRNHAGQIGFPGGTFNDADKDLMRTALRETLEEVGVRIDERDVVGSLRMVHTLASNFTILPFVAVLGSSVNCRPDGKEIESVLDAPLLELLSTMKPDTEHAEHGELYKFKHGSNIVWGATARILKQLHDIFKKGGMI